MAFKLNPVALQGRFLCIECTLFSLCHLSMQVQFEGISNAVGGVNLWILGAVHGAEKEKVSESSSRRAAFSFFLFQHQHCDLIHNRNSKWDLTDICLSSSALSPLLPPCALLQHLSLIDRISGGLQLFIYFFIFFWRSVSFVFLPEIQNGATTRI